MLTITAYFLHKRAILRFFLLFYQRVIPTIKQITRSGYNVQWNEMVARLSVCRICLFSENIQLMCCSSTAYTILNIPKVTLLPMLFSQIARFDPIDVL